MADVTMPRLSDTMEEGTIASWLKKPGEEIKKGDVIAQIETDKATMDLTAFEAGTLQEILAPEGTTVAIGKPVARIGSGAPASKDTKASSEPGADQSPAARANQPSAPPEDGPQSPAARAEASGVEAGGAEGSGAEAGGAEGSGAEAAHAEAPGAEAARAEAPGAEAGGAEQPRTAVARESAGEAPEPTASPADQPTTDADTNSNGVSAAGARPSTSSGDASPSSVSPGTEGSDAANGKVRASPMARHMAAEHGLDLGVLKGSGPQGRVIRADVEAALESKSSGSAAEADDAAVQSDGGQARTDGAAVQADGGKPPSDGAALQSDGGQPRTDGAAVQADGGQPPSDGDERVLLSQMRRTIARRMAESTRTVPHFFLITTVDATELVKLRKQVLEQIADAGIKITFNDMVLKAAALALRKVPDVNVSFAEDSLVRHQHVHIGIAVATDRGLIVPVVRDADQKSLGQIARETRDLAERANAGKLQPADYTGGTFTISNLGMFGIEQFNAVINPPESAILAVGAITREPAEHDGEIVLRERMKLTLSVDHRALDGAIGARYLQALKQLLEKPMLLLL
jgi:pyruvate dehydrogenase E2 component (dihydrolipoamide acetyltransferase)